MQYNKNQKFYSKYKNYIYNKIFNHVKEDTTVNSLIWKKLFCYHSPTHLNRSSDSICFSFS